MLTLLNGRLPMISSHGKRSKAMATSPETWSRLDAGAIGMRGRARARLSAGVMDASARRTSDPRTMLTSLGGTVYTWDVATDAIVWGTNAAEVFGLACISALATGRG